MRSVCTLAIIFSISALSWAGPNSPNGANRDPRTGGKADFWDWFSDQPPEIPAEDNALIQPPKLNELKKWQEFSFPERNKSSKYYLALDSVTPGADEVVRYVVAVVPGSGASKSVIYEGMHCNSGQYRAYAWGKPDQTWTVGKTVNWKQITRGFNQWQYALTDRFCFFLESYNPDLIKRRFDFPVPERTLETLD
ncbi:CNP1-like family protein [Chitinibacter sp. ZOR0017]|uniref:CNP1-like family protein n=1 Tax=Chitinibacter sp. ZOR0017 TaxID=1339254 RepID=UPI00068B13CD|nr:CNP1-like family protein [Chitinibacter sp. ZOR0017]